MLIHMNFMIINVSYSVQFTQWYTRNWVCKNITSAWIIEMVARVILVPPDIEK